MMARVLIATWFSLLVAFPARAQQPASAPAETPAPINTSVPATLSGADMLTNGRDYREQANPIMNRLAGMIEQAKKDRDIIRVNCLRDKLDQIKLNAEKMDVDLRALEDATNRQDQGEATHSYTRITILNQNIKTLDAYAEQCVGQGLTYVGATRVEVMAPADLPARDYTTVPPPPPADVPGRLSPASPYL